MTRRPFAKLPVKPTNCWLSSNLNGAPGEIGRGLSLKITLYITNLANKNAVIYTNEGNFDLRETVNEPRVFGVRLSYRFGKQSGNTEN
jgi:hypothetical protein